MYKICSKCKEKRLFNQFSKNKSCKDGYHSNCKICNAEDYKLNRSKRLMQQSEYRLTNKDQIIEYQSNYRVANKNKIVLQKAEYYSANKDRIVEYQSEYNSEYRAANKDRINARNSKRRAAKLNALPKWLTKYELEQIKELYTCAQMFKLYTGEEYHVDHIVPLQGENVCGLHVPWNLQVIPAKENLSKSNKLQEELL